MEGPHHIDRYFKAYNLSKEEVDTLSDQIAAFWAWSQENRLMATSEAVDVTEFFEKAAEYILRILEEDTEVLEKGREWKREGKALADASLCGTVSDPDKKYLVALRKSDRFTNHLYEVEGKDDSFTVVDAVVAHNTETGAITVSFADPIPGKSAGEFVKMLWGDLAGGHAAIGGSPRGQVMEDDLKEVAEKLLDYLNG